jgi:signal transduction histidine kinase
MDDAESFAAARGITDQQDHLVSADLPLALLQERCGGTMPGVLAIPELLEQVRHARRIGLRIARQFSAYDGADMVSGFVRISPRGGEEGGGCELLVESWQRSPARFASSHALANYLDAVDRASAEIIIRLDARQHLQAVGALSADGAAFAQALAAAPGNLWSEHVELQDVAHRQPLHWRLLDGAHCRLAGSERLWRVRLLPVAGSGRGHEPIGFELLLIADEPLADESAGRCEDQPAPTRLFGRTLTPALRQPLARIIANAETIRARLAGPLHHDYCHYAATIASAGQHLSTMLDDLADLEVVEAEGFTTIREEVDLREAARMAIGILGVRARDKRIALELEDAERPVIAMAEFRRVLQILINLIGNAVAYSPPGSTVRICASGDGVDRACLTVRDAGPGVSAEQAERIFEKFERLGRDNAGGTDQGSGLGLYISRLLARAMSGDLSLASIECEGAAFTLELPRAC